MPLYSSAAQLSTYTAVGSVFNQVDTTKWGTSSCKKATKIIDIKCCLQDHMKFHPSGETIIVLSYSVLDGL